VAKLPRRSAKVMLREFEPLWRQSEI